MRTRPTLTWHDPDAELPRTTSLVEVVDVVGRGRVAVLSGAGIATESGIPARAGKPVLIINRGRTRGDKEATVRVDRPLGQALTELVNAV